MTNEEQIVIECVCPECGKYIEEVVITEDDEEIVCTACGAYISIESTYMSAEKLIKQVEECEANNWKNSDIGREGELMLEVIAGHFRSCESCRKAFDDQRYEDETIQEFANEFLSCTDISEWIGDCKKVVEVGYYDLVRVTPTHASTFHIPAPFFLRTQRRIDFVFALPVAKDLRGNDYYSCPRCGENHSSQACVGGVRRNYTRENSMRN